MNWVCDDNVALLTDLYELTMGASYFARGRNGEATFDLFARELPAHRNFLVACGLDEALGYLQDLSFDDDAIDYLRSLGLFEEEFLSYLAELTFTGEVRAIAEGEVVFPGEPLLSVTAPLIEAQIVETFLLNCISFQTTIASKAARIALACNGRPFMDMSPRRDHGADAALKAARAAYVGGASGTSNVLAGKVYGLAVQGTMAHSYVMAFDSEIEAFRNFCLDFPTSTVLLIDTFDVEEGARRAVRVARELAPQGVVLRGVRIDSGRLAPLARSVRKILDEGGLEDVRIVLSGDLDEHRIQMLLNEAVPVDAFGVGTQLGTSADAPALGCVYKLVAEEGRPRIKLSAGKATTPARKQLYRFSSGDCYERDLVAGEEEDVTGGRPLLECVMEGGRRKGAPPPLADARRRCEKALARLPARLRTLEGEVEPYRVDLSEHLEDLVRAMRARGGDGAAAV
jgi:nicotinate phosphoribosyltransferase